VTARRQSFTVRTEDGDIVVAICAEGPIRPRTQEALEAVARVAIAPRTRAWCLQRSIETDMTDTVNAGDLAEYVGPHKPLVGRRCIVDSYTPTGKRLRVDVRIDGGAIVRRLVLPAHLKRLGGGC